MHSFILSQVKECVSSLSSPSPLLFSLHPKGEAITVSANRLTFVDSLSSRPTRARKAPATLTSNFKTKTPILEVLAAGRYLLAQDNRPLIPLISTLVKMQHSSTSLTERSSRWSIRSIATGKCRIQEEKNCTVTSNADEWQNIEQSRHRHQLKPTLRCSAIQCRFSGVEHSARHRLISVFPSQASLLRDVKRVGPDGETVWDMMKIFLLKQSKKGRRKTEWKAALGSD